MNEPNKLAAWMSEKEYSYAALAQELGLSYILIFKVAKGDRTPSTNFEMAFVNRFGREEAAKVFGDSPLLMMLSHA